MKDGLKKSDEWKVQLTIKPEIMSSTNTNEKRTKSDSNIIMIANDTDEIVQELFDSILPKYQVGLEQSMKSSNFIFDSASSMLNICNKISINCVRLRMGSH